MNPTSLLNTVVKMAAALALASTLISGSQAAVVTFQQGVSGYSGSTDTNIRSGAPTTASWPSISTTNVVGQVAANNNAIRGLYSFNLSSISGQSVSAVSFTAVFGTDFGGSGPVSLDLYLLTTPFTDSSATWNTTNGSTAWTTPGGDFTTLLVSQTGNPNNGVNSASGTTTWTFSGANFTSAVNTVVNSGNQTFNFLVKLTNENTGSTRTIFQINDIKNPTASLRPLLSVTTVPEPATVAMVLAGLGFILVARKSRRRQPTL